MNSLTGRDLTNEFNFNALTTDGRLTNVVRNVASAGTRKIYGYLLHNPNGSESFMQVFYKPAIDVALGTTAPDLIVKISANGSVAWDFSDPRGKGATGMSVAATTTDTGSTALTIGLSGVVFYV